MACGRKIGPYDCCSVVQGDCLELMKAIPDGAINAVITDPPYGTQALGGGYGRRRLHSVDGKNGRVIANDHTFSDGRGRA